MSATAILSRDTTPASDTADDLLSWDLDTAPSVMESDTWLLSFIDVLTLLLALFVLLLAQEHQRNKAIDSDIYEQPVPAVYEPEPIPTAPILQPFSTIQLPALPQIITPLSHLRMPVHTRIKKPAKETPEVDKLASTKESKTNVDETIKEAQPPEMVTTLSPVNRLMEALHASGLTDRIDVQSHTDSLHLDIADSILFAPARTTLTENGITLLGELAATLKTLPWSLAVEGHTDNVPIKTARFPSNWELSTARASAVARELIRHGVQPDRIRAVGYADTQPLVSNDTPEGRNRNRRVTFVLELPKEAQVERNTSHNGVSITKPE